MNRRTDSSDRDCAPVVTCFVRYRNRILLLRRSDRVGTYRGKWGTVAGYLDGPIPIQEAAYAEMEEEVGIPWQLVRGMRMGSPFEFHDPAVGTTWLVHPVLADLKSAPVVKLDFEHTDFRWILPGEVESYDTVPRLAESLRRVLHE